MQRKQVIWAGMLVSIYLFILSIHTVDSSSAIAEPLPSPEGQLNSENQIKQAILTAATSNEKYAKIASVVELQVTDIAISSDGQWVTAWVVYYDPQVDAIIPTEPLLTVAHQMDNAWKVYLPSDPAWLDTINSVPDDFLSADQKELWTTMYQGNIETYPTQSGYLLPWHGGETSSLSRSVGHDADFNTAHFAFDFYRPGNTQCPGGGGGFTEGTEGLNFNLYAAREGTVWGWKDSVVDCDHNSVNFIVLRNVDDPSIFQLYMHLSQNSIPPALKSVGTLVARGQFIGVADNTGISTGSHLHFQIEHQPNWPPDNPYWNTALDMTFDDVDINGGRPRVSPLDPPYCKDTDICQVFRQTYVSNNYYLGDSIPPTGGLSGVSQGQTVSSPTLTLSGWGTDAQTGLDYGQLIANFNGAWHVLGPQFNPDFSYTWNFCDPGLSVANGPVSVALRLYDIAGNSAPLVGLRQFTKAYTCPIPRASCYPANNQVTLFEDANYQGGCSKFDVGSYPSGTSLNPIGNNDTESIMVGDQVLATLFSEENFDGHSQSIMQDYGYMQSLWAPPNTLSSMKIALRTNLPASPILVAPTSGTIFRQGDVVPLSWKNGSGAMDYRVEIYSGQTLIRDIYWISEPVVFVDSLGQGSYTWRVRGRNQAGGSSWSEASSFTIASPLVIPPSVSAPYTDTMETNQYEWVNTGLWAYKSDPGLAHSGTHSWWYQNTYGTYNDGLPNFGFLTSPRISIPVAGYYLRFYYRYESETQGTTWDQRWVQISIDDGPFVNLAQEYDDPLMPETSAWMRNKAIDLSSYAGHIIRIRFQFSTFDVVANNYSGWGIDDIDISTTPPITCSENRDDDTPANAFLLAYSSSITVPGEICPNGDYDYYKFYGTTGDRIVADIDAMIDGSPLDSYLFLLDSDGQTVLAENDDEVYGQLRDPLISYSLSTDGEYYLKLRAWKHPLTGGESYSYSIRLYQDRTTPTAAIAWPTPNSFLPDTDIPVLANVTDTPNGVNRVEFYWHSMDWLSDAWEYFGTDRDGADGWSATFNPAGQPEGTGAAFYIQAYDNAGNWKGAAVWNLGIDKTPPVTTMEPLAPTQPSTAFALEWTGSDAMSGIDYYQFQQSVNGGSFTNLPPADETETQYWVVGDPGNSYGLRMRGVDHSGNTELYPGSAEATTAIPAGDVICYSLDNYDIPDDDNSPANANPIYANGSGQVHNYCNPLSPTYQNDEDWVKMAVVHDKHYFIQAFANSPQTATVISVFDQDGTTLLKERMSPGFGQKAVLMWASDRDGLVYVRFKHLDGRAIGTGVSTTVSVISGNWTYLPYLTR